MPSINIKAADLDTIRAVAERRLIRARTQLLLDRQQRFVFFATLALHLQPTEAVGLGTLAVDGVHLFYDPLIVASDHWSDEDLLFVVAHEATHCALGHPWRIAKLPQPVNMRAAQYAADYVVNGNLVAAGLTAPKEALLKPGAEDQFFEQVYFELLKNPPPEPQGGSQGDGGPGQPHENYGNCGAVWDAASPKPGQSAVEVAAKAAEAQRQWEIIARQAAQIAKAQGHLPGGFSHLVEPIKPRLDPYTILRQYLDATRHDDFSWRRPNRHFIYDGLYIPSLWSEGIGEVLLAIDTSGSVDDATVAEFLGFVGSVLSDVRPERTHLLLCDAQVHSHTIFEAGEELPRKVKITGRGGTDMRPIWAYAQKHGITHPVCAVVLSDMEMDDASFGPRGGLPHPVVWVSSTRDGNKAPFGETVELPQ